MVSPPVPRGMLLLVLAVVAASCVSSVHAANYSTISSSFGVSASQGMFPEAANTGVTVACATMDPATCAPTSPPALCLSRDAIQSTLSPSTFASLYARFDVKLVIESQELETDSLVLTEVLRIILSEVAGYATKVVVNQEYHTQLPRCANHAFHFHPQIWRTDWSDVDWAETFTQNSPCEVVGPSGIVGQDGWFADTYTVQVMAAITPVPTALGFWMSYTTQLGVQGLPRLNLTEAAADHVNLWFIPPQCLVPAQICGVAYAFSNFWEPSIPQQQVTNLGLRFAIMFPANPDDWFSLVGSRLASHQQVIFFYYLPDTFTADPAIVTRVALPQASQQCYSNATGYADASGEWTGLGSVACDFRLGNLLKVQTRNDGSMVDEPRLHSQRPSDLADAYFTFSRFSIPDLSMLATLATVNSGTSVADASCAWVRANAVQWASWLPATLTPRVREVTLATATANGIRALMGVFLLIALIAGVYMFVNRESPVMRQTSYVFNQMIVGGAALWYVALIVGMERDSVATCVASQFIMSAAFSCFYVAFLSKSYRIYAIFSAAQFRKVSLRDGRLLMLWAGYASIDMALVILWSAVSTPRPTLVEHSTQAYALVSKCGDQGSAQKAFIGVLYFIRACALLAGAFLAIRIRAVSAAYNESASLGLILYNILAVSAIVLGIQLISSNDPAVTEGSWTAGVIVAVFFSLIVFLIPKVRDIRSKGARNKSGNGNKTALTALSGDSNEGPQTNGANGVRTTGGATGAASSTPRKGDTLTDASSMPTTARMQSAASPRGGNSNSTANGFSHSPPLPITAIPLTRIPSTAPPPAAAAAVAAAAAPLAVAVPDVQVQLLSPAAASSVDGSPPASPSVAHAAPLSPRSPSNMRVHVSSPMQAAVVEYLKHREAFLAFMANTPAAVGGAGATAGSTHTTAAAANTAAHTA